MNIQNANIINAVIWRRSNNIIPVYATENTNLLEDLIKLLKKMFSVEVDDHIYEFNYCLNHEIDSVSKFRDLKIIDSSSGLFREIRNFAQEYEDHIASHSNQLITDEKCLKVLSEIYNSNVALVIVDIAIQTGISDKTVGKKIKELINHNLVHRPNGKRKGILITQKGKNLIEKYRSSS